MGPALRSANNLPRHPRLRLRFCLQLFPCRAPCCRHPHPRPGGKEQAECRVRGGGRDAWRKRNSDRCHSRCRPLLPSSDAGGEKARRRATGRRSEAETVEACGRAAAARMRAPDSERAKWSTGSPTEPPTRRAARPHLPPQAIARSHRPTVGISRSEAGSEKDRRRRGSSRGSRRQRREKPPPRRCD